MMGQIVEGCDMEGCEDERTQDRLGAAEWVRLQSGQRLENRPDRVKKL